MNEPPTHGLNIVPSPVWRADGWDRSSCSGYTCGVRFVRSLIRAVTSCLGASFTIFVIGAHAREGADRDRGIASDAESIDSLRACSVFPAVRRRGRSDADGASTPAALTAESVSRNELLRCTVRCPLERHSSHEAPRDRPYPRRG